MTDERPGLGHVNRCDVLDVSTFQRGIDYARVAAAGFQAAIVRASWGTDIDGMAAQHMIGFRSVGMLVGVYGAARPELDNPEAQADTLLRGMGVTYTRAFLDLETRGGRSNAQLVEFAERFCARVDTAGALACGFYSYPDYEQHLQPELGASSLGSRPLWQAFYGGAQPWAPHPGDLPRVSRPWMSATFWQYGGDTGYRVPGVPGPCDRSLFIGNTHDLRAFFGLPDPTVPDYSYLADTPPES